MRVAIAQKADPIMVAGNKFAAPEVHAVTLLSKTMVFSSLSPAASSAASSCSVRPKSVQYLVEAQPEILTLMYPGAQPSP